MTQEKAVACLAMKLFERIEMLDPSGFWDEEKSTKENWDALELQSKTMRQSFYISCVEWMLISSDVEEVLCAMGSSAGDNGIDRG